MSETVKGSDLLPLKLQDAAVEVEHLGELFLINRERQIAVDRQRNSTREALTALRKQCDGHKVWMQKSTDSFARSSREAAVSQLQAGELESCDPCALYIP